MTAAEDGNRGRRPRLLIVGALPPPLHGVTVMTAALLNGALNDDFEVLHADTSDHRTVANIGRFELANVMLALCHGARFVAMLRRHHPDLVYLPLSQNLAGFLRDAMFLMAARATRTPVMVHAHGAQHREFFQRSPAALRALMRVILAPVRDIVVLAENLRSQFDGWTPANARVSVVPNGVVDEWQDGTPSRDGRLAATVLYLGNLDPQKGFLDILEAVSAVLAHRPRTRFIFAGQSAWDKSTAQAVNSYLADSAVSRAVSFVGAVDPKRRHELLGRADLVVFPPRWNEGQGLVAIEAMSAGLPLVVTSSGGLAETVRDGREGLVVPKSCPQAIADSVLRLLGDAKLRARLGAAGRQRFESEYTIDGWLTRMHAALSEAVDDHDWI